MERAGMRAVRTDHTFPGGRAARGGWRARSVAAVLGATAFLALLGCNTLGATSAGGGQAPPPAAYPAAATAATDSAAVPDTLGLRVYRRLLADGKSSIALSPVSLEAAVALVGEGATPAWKQRIGDAIGRSYETLAGFDDAARSEKAQLTIASAIWLPDTTAMLPSYSDRLIKGYGAHAESVSFGDGSAVKKINDWVSGKTAGAIPTLVDRLPGNSALVLTTAMYFKGAWLRPFDPEKTMDGEFTTAVGTTVKTRMMHQAGSFPFVKTTAGTVVQLFYTDTNLSLTLYLPDRGANPGVVATDIDGWLFAGRKPGLQPTHGNVSFPRFGLSAAMDLTTVLEQTGLQGLFGDSSIIVGVRSSVPPALSRAVQRTRIDVDEAGTIAAAATALMGVRSATMGTFSFVADRPFHFSLRHEDVAAPLLVGYVADPS